MCLPAQRGRWSSLSPCRCQAAQFEVWLLLGCLGGGGTEGTDCDARTGRDTVPMHPPCTTHFCAPSLLASQDGLWFFPAWRFWVISHGNDLWGSSALMPFPDPRLPDSSLMLITKRSSGGFFLHHTLLKQILSLFWIFQLCLLLNWYWYVQKSLPGMRYETWSYFPKTKWVWSFSLTKFKSRLSLNPIKKKIEYAGHSCIASFNIICSSYSHFHVFTFLMISFSFLFATSFRCGIFFFF